MKEICFKLETWQMITLGVAYGATIGLWIYAWFRKPDAAKPFNIGEKE